MRLDQFLYAYVLAIRCCFSCYYALILGSFDSVDDSAKMNACYTIRSDLVRSRIGYFGNCLIKVYYVKWFSKLK
jgi:hypothetical protein